MLERLRSHELLWLGDLREDTKHNNYQAFMQASLLPQRTFTQDTSEVTPRYTTRGTPPPPQRREQQVRRSRPMLPPTRQTTPPDSATSSSNSASLPPPAASKSPPVHQPGDRAFTLQRESPITATSTSNNETLVPKNQVCWHYMRRSRAQRQLRLLALCWVRSRRNLLALRERRMHTRRSMRALSSC